MHFKSSSKRTACVVPRASKKFDLNELVEKRKEIDKQRVNRLKEIGNSLDHIAKAELKSAKDIFNEFFPFVKDLPKCQEVKKEEKAATEK